jgi:hypothetical protein
MRYWLTVAAIGLLVVLADRLGRRPERAVAVTLATSFVLTVVNTALRGEQSFRWVNPVVFAIDATAWLMLCHVALRANRLWPITVASLQTIVLIAHFSVFMHTGWKKVYWGMMAISQYLQMLIVLWGIIQHHFRERRVGRYRDWRKY